MIKQNFQCFMLIDNDRKMFGVISTNESNSGNWEKRVNEQKNKGRDILGYNSEKSVEQAISDYQNQYKYVHTSISNVLNIYS